MKRILNLKKKGQIALEYLVIVAFALLIAAPIIFNAQSSTVDLSTVSKSSMAKDALVAIKESAELVYSQGEPARISFKINLPFGINESVVDGHEISYTLNSRTGPIKIYQIVDFNVTGIIPLKPGTHTLTTRAEENYVNISY